MQSKRYKLTIHSAEQLTEKVRRSFKRSTSSKPIDSHASINEKGCKWLIRFSNLQNPISVFPARVFAAIVRPIERSISVLCMFAAGNFNLTMVFLEL